jgi:hypothetical protein
LKKKKLIARIKPFDYSVAFNCLTHCVTDS